MYELLVACFYYAFIAASLAELASSIPAAGGVYCWASITPGRRLGRIIGFYAGIINFFGWVFDLASVAYATGQLLTQLYATYHGDLEIQQWHIFVAMTCATWLCVFLTIFFNRFLPLIQYFGMTMVLLGGVITIIVIAAMPAQHASRSFVWTDFENVTGWPNGLAFMTGVLNGAFAIGTPDAVTHMAEELPNPKRDIPRAIAAQIGLGTVYAFIFIMVCFYGVYDLDAVLDSNGGFPLAEMYRQATGSAGATFGLLFIILLIDIATLVATFLTVSRTFWALARDNAVPFPKIFSYVNEKLSCPVPSTLLCGTLTTAFGAIAIGSRVAFNDLVGSFVILTTVSYALAIGPHMFSGRKNVPKGDFWMGAAGYFVNGFALITIILFDIFFCFPYTYPTTVDSMNYNSVILVGVVTLTTIWWLVHGLRKYEGPKSALLHDSRIIAEERKLSKV